MTSRRARAGTAAVVAGLWASAAVLAGCGDDEGTVGVSSEVCQAAGNIEREIKDLQDLDLSSTSLDELKDEVADVGDEVKTIREAGDGELSAQTDALKSSLDDLGDAIADLGSTTSLSDAIDQIQLALRDVVDAAEDLEAAADDICD